MLRLLFIYNCELLIMILILFDFSLLIQLESFWMARGTESLGWWNCKIQEKRMDAMAY